MMSSSSAFNLSACGAMSQSVADHYHASMNEYYASYSVGNEWLNETLTRVKNEHDLFYRSRVWEFKTVIDSDKGLYVGKYEVGYLGPLFAQQKAEGYMREIISAHPLIKELYNEERVSCYNGDIGKLNNGVGDGNYYYRKTMDGSLALGKEDDSKGGHKVYLNSYDQYTHLTVRERINACKTWKGVEKYVEKGYDPTAIDGGMILTPEEVEERRKLLEEIDKE